MPGRVHRVQRRPVGSHRRYVVHVHVDHRQQLVHRLGVRGPPHFHVVLLLAAHLVTLHQLLLHLDRFAHIDECARSVGDAAKMRSLSEGVSLEVVHAHGHEIEVRFGMIAHESQTHDGNAHLERQEVE